MDDGPGASRRVYLDHAATTPVREEVEEAMRPFLRDVFGNPSSLHAEGQSAREALESARESLRSRCGASGFDLVFCSGGTEADNAALVGVCLAARGAARGPGAVPTHVVTSAVEHAAVLQTVPTLETLGAEVSIVPVGGDGRVVPGAVASALCSRTILASVQAANNETGAIQPFEEIGACVRARGALMHTDAVQALGKIPLELDALPVDLVTISSHKVHGPKGIAGLFVRRGIPFAPFLRGGAQEGGLRAGTQNVAAAIGFARAVELAEEEREKEMRRLGSLRDLIRAGIAARFHEVRVNSPGEPALPTILNVSFPRVEGESLVRLLDWMGFAVSTGSACNVGARKPSHVLGAMGLGDREVRGSLRISLGRSTSRADAEAFLDALERAVRQLEGIAPARA